MKIAVALIVAALSCLHSAVAADPKEKDIFKREIVLKESDVIWSFAFLPDGRIVYTLRTGQLKVFDPKSKKTVLLKGLPAVYVSGQAGLLDVLVDREFEKNHRIFWTFIQGSSDRSAPALASGTLEKDELKNAKVLRAAEAWAGKPMNWGSRVAQSPDGFLFWSIGDRDDRVHPLTLDSHLGKILRVDRDGKAAAGNPFAEKKGALPEIWSIGHRNPQGLFFDDATNTLWECEHGPRGGDEINRIEKGKNYGWPKVTYGREYSGPEIGVKEKKGTEQPVKYWVPSISPSAIVLYRGSEFPQWNESLFVASLSAQHLGRFDPKSQREERYFENENRVRDVRVDAQGALWYSTDEGHLYKLTAAKPAKSK